MNQYKHTIITFFIICGLSAQKTIYKEFSGDGIKDIFINTDLCFKLNLTTHLKNSIEVNAIMEGEYKDDVLLISKEGERILNLGVDFNDVFLMPNDKLSAHKVVSVSLDIKVPERLTVYLLGRSAIANIEGSYERLSIQSNDAPIILNHVLGDVSVQSVFGNIFLYAEKGHVEATSKYGTITTENISPGNNNYMLNTVNGSIYMNRKK